MKIFPSKFKSLNGNAVSSRETGASLMKGFAAVISLCIIAAALPTTAKAAAKSMAEMKAEYTRPAAIPFPEENGYSKEKAELGKMLFFDPRLSGNNQITCAFCHNPSIGWSDGQSMGFGSTMNRLGRKTPTILNLAWSEPLMWDGRFDDLEEQALGPVGAAVEMNQKLEELVPELEKVKGYRVMFNIVFPGEGITLDNIAKAIATFERTVVSGIAPFDRWIAGDESAISESAKRGFTVYNGKARCAQCHSGWNLTDDSFHDIGLPNGEREITTVNGIKVKAGADRGRGAFFKNIEIMQSAFRTPGLRNLPQRAPYMHDGALHTLRDVIDHYDTGGIKRSSLSPEMKPLKLSEGEKKDLEEFLLTLVSNDPLIAMPELPR